MSRGIKGDFIRGDDLGEGVAKEDLHEMTVVAFYEVGAVAGLNPAGRFTLPGGSTSYPHPQQGLFDYLSSSIIVCADPTTQKNYLVLSMYFFYKF